MSLRIGLRREARIRDETGRTCGASMSFRRRTWNRTSEDIYVGDVESLGNAHYPG
jgi:hypothetical protein